MITIKRNIPSIFKTDGIDRSYAESFDILCRNMKIDISEKGYIYFIDENFVFDMSKGKKFGNLTPDYETFLKYGLSQMKYSGAEITNEFCKDYNSVIDSLILLCGRIADALKNDSRSEWFRNMSDSPALSFDEAIQRMLFINQLMWQTDHVLVGLGAWDSFLGEYYEKGIEDCSLTRESALEKLRDVYIKLHDHYEYKSNVLMGDTGQIFVIGRSDCSGNYFCNDLTYLFIEAMKDVHQTEPKCLLRVNRNTPHDLIELSLKAISTGIGAPLLSNDDVILPQILQFGIPKEDACCYTTSACWEPLIGGKSISPNNEAVLNFVKPLDDILKRENLEKITDLDILTEKYIDYLRRYIAIIKRNLFRSKFQYDVLLSVFMLDCKENKKDVSHGGARYNNVGITSVAMGNLIDSFSNIKELVFDKKEYTLYDVKKCIILNYDNDNELLKRLKNKPSNYGVDSEELISLVNRITDCVAEEISEYRSYMGGRLKVGLSGSSYRDAALGFDATFDGRKFGEPFTVHISNEDNNGFTEIMNFASQLKYDRSRFNGNVVDVVTSPDFINNNFEKMTDLLIAGINAGFFEMQMNVVSSKILIEARKCPEKFPNLIVRVWGFSAYFKDLPDDYKDLIIERTIKSERG